ncbi:hypothetical protein [Nocardiopsis synnemataformans]|uniref:hypothetical protein n=1 Tax=Nocardiopsis synnemataformans TaxID=61305 RepID=UPI003EBC42AA
MSPAEEGGSALADIHRVVEVGLTAVNGRLDVIIERLEHQDRRADQHEAALAVLDTRLDGIDRAMATREDIDRVTTRVSALEQTAVTHTDMDARGRRTISIVALVVTGIGILVGTLTTVIITLTT